MAAAAHAQASPMLSAISLRVNVGVELLVLKGRLAKVRAVIHGLGS